MSVRLVLILLLGEVQSFVGLLLSASRPSWFGMFVYSELTSRVTNNALSGMCPSSLILLIKCCVSLTYDLVLGTYFLICSSTNLLMFGVGWFIELQIGLSGIFFCEFLGECKILLQLGS